MAAIPTTIFPPNTPTNNSISSSPNHNNSKSQPRASSTAAEQLGRILVEEHTTIVGFEPQIHEENSHSLPVQQPAQEPVQKRVQTQGLIAQLLATRRVDPPVAQPTDTTSNSSDSAFNPETSDEISPSSYGPLATTQTTQPIDIVPPSESHENFKIHLLVTSRNLWNQLNNAQQRHLYFTIKDKPAKDQIDIMRKWLT